MYLTASSSYNGSINGSYSLLYRCWNPKLQAKLDAPLLLASSFGQDLSGTCVATIVFPFDSTVRVKLVVSLLSLGLWLFCPCQHLPLILSLPELSVSVNGL